MKKKKKKGIKGTSVNGPIKKHPHFGWIQWNQSYSHMSQVYRAPGTAAEWVEEEPMDVDEPAAEQAKAEETVTMSYS